MMVMEYGSNSFTILVVSWSLFSGRKSLVLRGSLLGRISGFSSESGIIATTFSTGGDRVFLGLLAPDTTNRSIIGFFFSQSCQLNRYYLLEQALISE